jgi:hypothetical protein
MRKKLSFQYQGKSYTGYVIDSTDSEPHYYWLFFHDVELVKKFGDSIGFKMKNGQLVPTQRHDEDPAFVETIRELILGYAEKRSHM